jgi:hypothetical protein
MWKLTLGYGIAKDEGGRGKKRQKQTLSLCLECRISLCGTPKTWKNVKQGRHHKHDKMLYLLPTVPTQSEHPKKSIPI